MKYDIFVRFVAAIAFFTFVPFAESYPWLMTLFTAAGIFFAVTGVSKIFKPR